MKKILIFVFILSFSYSIAFNCTCLNYTDCLNKYTHSLFYGNYSEIVCYGNIILNNYTDYFNYNEIDMIKASIAHALKNLNETNLSLKFLKESGFIIKDSNPKYIKHFINEKKENIKKNNNLMLMLIFLLITIICLYLIYLEKIKKVLS